ncbi:MAG: PAS domain S-box protein, partial [Candidatus Contubernalis sp.]|nr:PAS domain S-box protein [Candidatus Contubernalis sp.]
MKILLVGEYNLLKQLKSILYRSIGEHIKVHLVESCKAIDVTKEECPDIIIMDVKVTYENLQLLRDFKALDEDIHVLVLTDNGDNHLTINMENDADSLITKPFEEKELTALIKSAQKAREKIKALRKKEKALQESAELFRALVDFTPDWDYLIVADSKFIYVSPSCEQITGYRPEEFKNEAGLLKITHMDDRAALHNHLKGALRSSESLSIDYRIIHRSGEERWISHVCQPFYSSDGTLIGRRASNRDITRQKQLEEALQRAHNELEEKVWERTSELAEANEELQAEINERIMVDKALQESEMRYRTLIDNIPIGIYRSTTEPEGRFLMANSAFYKIFGLNSEDDLQKLRV